MQKRKTKQLYLDHAFPPWPPITSRHSPLTLLATFFYSTRASGRVRLAALDRERSQSLRPYERNFNGRRKHATTAEMWTTRIQEDANSSRPDFTKTPRMSPYTGIWTTATARKSGVINPKNTRRKHREGEEHLRPKVVSVPTTCAQNREVEKIWGENERRSERYA